VGRIHISLINGHPPKIIWIRTGNLSTDDIAELLILRKVAIDEFLHDGEYEDISCIEIE
jgi:predicted nuclease of predicted toxin-antitoxin system